VLSNSNLAHNGSFNIVREELINGSLTPFACNHSKAAGINCISSLCKRFKKLSHPNIHDLYWKGAGGLGNPDLKTEVSIVVKQDLHSIHLLLSAPGMPQFFFKRSIVQQSG